MEALLEKIVQNTEPKSSLQSVVSNNKTRSKTRFNPPIQLDKKKKYEIALVNLETYYSFPNIDSTNNYFRYSPDGGATWFEIYLSEGSYDITDINDTIQLKMKQNGHYDSISSVLVNIDIVSGSYINGSNQPTVYSFFPNASPGYKIIETPINLVYLPVTLDTIHSMETSLTDQNGKLLNLRGENLTMMFHIREI